LGASDFVSIIFTIFEKDVIQEVNAALAFRMESSDITGFGGL